VVLVVLVALQQMAAKVPTQYLQQSPPQVEDLVKEKVLEHLALVVLAVGLLSEAHWEQVMKAAFLPSKVITAVQAMAMVVAEAAEDRQLVVMQAAAQQAQVVLVQVHQLVVHQ
jgi:hypothetical protein